MKNGKKKWFCIERWCDYAKLYKDDHLLGIFADEAFLAKVDGRIRELDDIIFWLKKDPKKVTLEELRKKRKELGLLEEQVLEGIVKE